MASRLAQVGNHLAAKGLLIGEVVIVTGAAQGIGRSTAILAAAEGAHVVVADLDLKKANSVVAEIQAAGGDAIVFGGDITAQDYPKDLIKKTIDTYGKLNHLCLVAGFTADKMLHTMDDSTFELMLKVHNTAPFRLIREAAPYLRLKTPEGMKANKSIVTVSSTSGLHGNVGQANYAVAKAGIVGLTKTVAKEWGPFNVRCNTIAYGYIETRLTQAKELGEVIIVDGKSISLGIPGQGKGAQKSSDRVPDIPLGRAGTADEAAKALIFLISPMASYISGHTLEVTGGRGI